MNLPVTFFRNYSAGDLANRSLAVSQIHATLSGTTVLSILWLVLHHQPFPCFTTARRSPPSERFGIHRLVVMVTGGLFQPAALQVAENVQAKSPVWSLSLSMASRSSKSPAPRWAGAFVAQKKLAASSRRITNMSAASTPVSV